MRWLAVLGAIALSACGHMDLVEDDLDFASRQRALDAISDWDMRGSLVIDTGERSYQARFTWLQRGERLELLVRGLLGARSFRIEGSPAALTVETGGETQLLTEPEGQLSEMLGWWLPVTSAEHWLLGEPDPDYPAISDPGSAETLAGIVQRDWQIRYDEYQLVDGLLVPRRITLTDAPLELILAIRSWESIGAAP